MDSADASRLTGKVIDLSDPLHFYLSTSGISYDGFAMMRVDGANSKTVPSDGVTIAAENFYKLVGSTTQSSYYTYIRSSDAETIKNYDENGYYTEEQYEDGTLKYDHGMGLKYRAGSSEQYYIAPGYYRFVYFHGQSKLVTYSDVYQITDTKGIFTEPGITETKITASGGEDAQTVLFSDGIYDLKISGLTGADSNAVSLNNAKVTKIEFLTDAWGGIPNDGTSDGSVVSYDYNNSYLMYDGTDFGDGRTLEASASAITLRGFTAKYKRYGYLISLCDSGNDYKYRVKALLEELANLEYAIEMAGVQDAFTQSVSDKLSWASGIVGIGGGPVGAEGALVIDTINVLINAANDTNNAEVMEAAEKFKSKVDKYMSTDKADKERMKKSEQEKKDYNNSMGFPIYGVEDEVFDDPFDSSSTSKPTAQTVPVHDPSGVVYEGVIENPVEGATVTLYKYDEENGVPVQHDDSAYLGQDNPLTTDEQGFYRWDVPEGEWYVTASKDGYISGNSGADIAATKSHTIGGETMNFLPVLPPQLDVNIPLVDKTAPEITDVTYTPQGIYVTFSKYMVDTGYNNNGSVLESNNYTLTDEDGPVTDFYVTSVVQGHAPSNIDQSETTYTKTVKISPAWNTTFEGELSLTVSGSVRSYADTALGEIYSGSGTAMELEPSFNITETANGAVIKNTALAGGDVTVIIAEYDDDGTLIEASPETITFAELEEKTVTFKSGGKHRVFVWNSLSGMKPLAK